MSLASPDPRSSITAMNLVLEWSGSPDEDVRRRFLQVIDLCRESKKPEVRAKATLLATLDPRETDGGKERVLAAIESDDSPLVVVAAINSLSSLSFGESELPRLLAAARSFDERFPAADLDRPTARLPERLLLIVADRVGPPSHEALKSFLRDGGGSLSRPAARDAADAILLATRNPAAILDWSQRVRDRVAAGEYPAAAPAVRYARLAVSDSLRSQEVDPGLAVRLTDLWFEIVESIGETPGFHPHLAERTALELLQFAQDHPACAPRALRAVERSAEVWGRAPGRERVEAERTRLARRTGTSPSPTPGDAP